MECKHCKNKALFYTKARPTGTIKTVYNADGSYNEEGFNAEMYDGVRHVEGKIYYCYMCEKKVAPVNNQVDDILNHFR